MRRARCVMRMCTSRVPASLDPLLASSRSPRLSVYIYTRVYNEVRVMYTRVDLVRALALSLSLTLCAGWILGYARHGKR